jgi:hypothetical protein
MKAHIRWITLILLFFGLFPAKSMQCLELFQPDHQTEKNAIDILSSLGANDLPFPLPLVRRRLLTKYEYFNTHPDYGDGFAAQLYIAKYKGQRVIIKKAKLTEARLAFALSELGIGPKFLGLAEHCECYVIEFIPDSVVIKKNRLDRRLNKFIENGFRLGQGSKEHILSLIMYFSNLGISSWDYNFLVNSAGRVYVIDFDPRYMTTHQDKSESKLEAKLTAEKFKIQFLEIEKRYPENDLGARPD